MSFLVVVNVCLIYIEYDFVIANLPHISDNIPFILKEGKQN